MSEIQAGVFKCIAESLSIDESELSPKTLLIKDLGADSLDIMDIMFQLEETFDIKLEKEDFDFLRKIEMDREQAVVEGLLTNDAKIKLKEFLPEIDMSAEIKPAELGNYLSVSSVMGLVHH
jgi:acyl carrier protein